MDFVGCVEHTRSAGKFTLKVSSQALYNPLVKRLGYVYLETDSVDTTLLRTRVIHQAALAEDQE
jgi:hypothetical protein